MTGGRCRHQRALPEIASITRESRSGRTRPGAGPSAIRALVLYPLNALAEDQMSRLRQALDSDRVRAWLGANRPGHRFWFGRYTGWTPISGSPQRDNAEAELRTELRRQSSLATRVAGTDAQRFFPRFDGGEMWSRWDMQDAPPDILITNYSMLNIMLMRDIEDQIFAATRRWLEDPANVFHLVVDELHTYRGTPGTEVGYILRVLYERLGLNPDHPQLRILASSASLGDDDARAQDYLRQFFGRSRPFTLIRGGAEALAPGSAHRLSALAGPIEQLGSSVVSASEADVANAVAAFAATASLSPPDAALSAGQQLGAALIEAGAPEAIRAACNDGTDESPTVVPQTIEALAGSLFPGRAAGSRRKRCSRPGHVPVCGPVGGSRAPPADARPLILPECSGRMGLHQPGVQRRALD